MPLPWSYLLGLVVMLGVLHVRPDLPRAVTLLDTLPYLVLCLVPWPLSRALVVSVPDRASPAARRLRAAMLALVVPASYAVLLTFGGFSRLAEQWAGSSVLLAVLIQLPALLVMEFTTARGRGLPATEGLRPELVVFVTIVFLLPALGLDLLALQREVYVLAGYTAIGWSSTLVLALCLLCLPVPWLFRTVMWRRLRPVRDELRQTAQQLGFPGRDVHVLDTGGTICNAMLVGPVPRFRYLFLTDGLVALLDRLSLQGVVAHEVGHARAGHVLLLLVAFGLVPVLLYHPLILLGVEEWDPWLQVALAVVVFAAVLPLLRRVAHRFELEADALSAEALGGAAPVILALDKVADLGGGSGASLRHPSEEHRIRHLLACEGDPWYRERFWRRGVRLRHLVLGALVVAMLASAWSQVALWPVDRLTFEYYTGRFAAAARTLAALPEPNPDRAEHVRHLAEELAVARGIHPDGGRWEAIHDDLGRRALIQGREVLLQKGPAAARPYFAVGMSKDDASPLEQSLYLLTAASAAGDAARVAEVREHLLASFDLDPELRHAIETVTPGAAGGQ